MEWVEKASFARLNKLFEISTSEHNYQIFFMDKNLQAVLKEAKSFILPILHRLAPRSLVPDNHHVLKDLPFNEVACATNSQAHQDRLKQKEKKKIRRGRSGKLHLPTLQPLTPTSILLPRRRRDMSFSLFRWQGRCHPLSHLLLPLCFPLRLHLLSLPASSRT